MKITDIQIHVCQHESSMGEDQLKGKKSNLEFLVIRMMTDEGIEGQSFGFAGRGARMAGEIAAATMKPWLLGRDPLYREALWHENRVKDRWWSHMPIYTYGPFDIAMWDIVAKKAGLPLFQLLGGYRDKVPTYASSLLHPTPDDYAQEALDCKNRGLHAYKLHPPGDYNFDLAAYRACREAVGDDFRLMADPVAAYNHEQAFRMGRELEKLNYYWLEEPVYDVDLYGLQKLTAKLDIPICGTEVIVGSHYATAYCIQERIVDMVRTDVSWKGGVTAVMKTAHLAESFGIQCELHTAIYHPLELVNLHCACAIKNCEFFEVLWPWDLYNFGLVEQIHVDSEGYAHVPQGPGLGIALDWDFIDKATVAVL
jgi:L-alanine-DL-glutamate epimerase-like enolase superfamily enzyme